MFELTGVKQSLSLCVHEVPEAYSASLIIGVPANLLELSDP